MPRSSAVASIAFCGNQPPHCCWARHRIGITADCWRPSGYCAILPLAQARFSGVKAKLGGCFSARRRTLIGPPPPPHSLPLKGGGSGGGSREANSARRKRAQRDQCKYAPSNSL